MGSRAHYLKLPVMVLCFILCCSITTVFAFLPEYTNKVVLLVCWGGFLLALTVCLSQFSKIGYLAILFVALVSAGFFLPKDQAIAILSLPNTFLDYVGVSISAGKILHIAVYGWLGAIYTLLILNQENKAGSTRILLTIAVLIAMCMSEVFQMFVPDRTSRLKDVLYNAFGISLGAVLVGLRAILKRSFATTS